MSLPYFPLYPTDFKADTSHLTNLQAGVYFRMIMECWTVTGCTIPNDMDWILDRIMSRKDDEAETIEAVKFVISEFFNVKKGRLNQKKLLEIYVTQNAKHKSKKIAGKKGGQANALKTKKKSSSKREAEGKQPEPEPEPIVKDPKGSKKKRVKTTWPSDDWKPDPLSEKMKTKLGLTREEYRNEFEKFRANCEAHGRSYLDWNAAWRTWLQSDYGTYGRRLAGQGGSKAGGAGGPPNGSGSSGLGGAVERAAKRRQQRQAPDESIIDITPRPPKSSSGVQTSLLTDDS